MLTGFEFFLIICFGIYFIYFITITRHNKNTNIAQILTPIFNDKEYEKKEEIKISKIENPPLQMKSVLGHSILGRANLTKKDKKLLKREASSKRLEKQQNELIEHQQSSFTRFNNNLNHLPNYVLDWTYSLSSHTSTMNTRISILFSKLTARNHPLTNDDLDPFLEQLKQSWISKNVIPHLTDAFCTIIRNKLLGKKLSTFETLYHQLYTCLREEIICQLECQHPNIVLNFQNKIIQTTIHAGKKKRPYKILFMGTNGVGKTTTLAKMVRWCQSNGFITSMIAGDTFRSGAVEQLRVHSMALKSRLHEGQPFSSPSKVALQGIEMATRYGDDVVLIDCAGRMNGNNTLMSELGHLIKVTVPDTILFVVEASTGNMSIEQLNSFESLVRDYHYKGIDYLILTKMDTVSEKIGTVINLVSEKKIPILFMGVGQTYLDLREFNDNMVLQHLLQR